eukprot:CAMPEP_0170514840 /NCGR_PEP_ID=MMETSP0209-20121228/1373_1 /TAXON_ID=665100 ORGANISM="Litonotus pictus, Strain P1" /NCGR_SAMPLE_ID=MMETSP0209 /ASSEMBLY_ACC=CAM_ASM_000301 /LENGTH=69 /DNA_ID=CAMNT_0010799081 /DNA_START=427 /DNA_END=636 /DNA_ORIENTATION=-
MSSFVIAIGDCSESFLTSSVPNLKLNAFLFQKNGFDLEVNTYSCQVVGGKGALSELQEKASLTNSGISD